MKITLAAILSRQSKSKTAPADRLFAEYLDRSTCYLPCESQRFDTEAAFITSFNGRSGRTPAYLILFDSCGQQLTSDEFAGRLGTLRDAGTQRLVLAIGPADGWSSAARERANLLLSFGRITLPHQLARVVLAEQVYRALTILAGHPYHSGH